MHLHEQSSSKNVCVFLKSSTGGRKSQGSPPFCPAFSTRKSSLDAGVFSGVENALQSGRKGSAGRFAVHAQIARTEHRQHSRSLIRRQPAEDDASAQQENFSVAAAADQPAQRTLTVFAAEVLQIVDEQELPFVRSGRKRRPGARRRPCRCHSARAAAVLPYTQGAPTKSARLRPSASLNFGVRVCVGSMVSGTMLPSISQPSGKRPNA